MEWTGSVVELGTGTVTRKGGVVRLFLPNAADNRYSDAQIDDTSGRSRRRFRWSPPVRLSLRARFSHPSNQLMGTAGFGFWNVPFDTGRPMAPALPRAIWFFHGSAPHDVPLAAGIPGFGWKAACLDAGRPEALCWIPLAPLALLGMRSRRIFEWLWPRIQRALAVSEATVPDDLRPWRRYAIDWGFKGVDFWVDDRHVLHAPVAPRGPLGFVAWLDNQYAIATPRGRFGWGRLGVVEPQWLEIADLEIE